MSDHFRHDYHAKVNEYERTLRDRNNANIARDTLKREQGRTRELAERDVSILQFDKYRDLEVKARKTSIDLARLNARPESTAHFERALADHNSTERVNTAMAIAAEASLAEVQMTYWEKIASAKGLIAIKATRAAEIARSAVEKAVKAANSRKMRASSANARAAAAAAKNAATRAEKDAQRAAEDFKKAALIEKNERFILINRKYVAAEALNLACEAATSAAAAIATTNISDAIDAIALRLPQSVVIQPGGRVTLRSAELEQTIILIESVVEVSVGGFFQSRLQQPTAEWPDQATSRTVEANTEYVLENANPDFSAKVAILNNL